MVLIFSDPIAALIGHGLRPPEVQGDPDLLLGLGVHDQLMKNAGSFALIIDGPLRSIRFGNLLGTRGLVIDLEVVVELHLVGVEVSSDFFEAHLELVDGDVDVAVALIVNVIDLVFDVFVLRLWTKGSVKAKVAVFAPRIAAFD